MANNEWIKIKPLDDVKTGHRRNEDARAGDKNLDHRLREAFQNYQKARSSIEKPRGEKSAGNQEVLKNSPVSMPAAVKPDLSQKVTQRKLEGDVKVAQTETKVKTRETEPTRSATAAGFVSPSKVQTERQASHFVLPPNQPSLTDLLLKKSSVPPAPPKAEEKSQAQIKNGLEPPQIKLADAAKVQAPIASDAGAKLADATKKQEGEVRKERKDKKGESGESAKSKGVVAHNTQRTTHDAALEAASSGVASGSGEPFWLADREPGVEVMNPYTKLDESLSLVLQKTHLYRRYILKGESDPKRLQVIEAIFTKALALDQEITHRLRGEVAASRNVYGVTRG